MDAGSESHRQESGPRGCVICAKIGEWLPRVLSVGSSLQTPVFGGGMEYFPSMSAQCTVHCGFPENSVSCIERCSLFLYQRRTCCVVLLCYLFVFAII